jgi:short-subunit dehydrogenase
MSGFMAGATCAPYAAAKAGVNSLMESYYLALKPYGIGVTCLCPGSIKSNIAESTYTRPKHLVNTGYHVDEKIIDSMGKFYAQGIEPVELANILKKGIEDEQLFVIPFPYSEKMLQDNFEHIVDYASPEGTRKQEKLMRQRIDENKSRGVVDNGWARARDGITWTKENPYANLHT